MPFLFTIRLRVLASTLHLDSQVPYVTITLRCYLTSRFPNLFCYKVFSATRLFFFFQTVFCKESGRHFASSSLSVELILAYQSLTFIRFFFIYFILFFHSFSIVIGCLNQWNLNVRRLESRDIEVNKKFPVRVGVSILPCTLLNEAFMR